ncbi:MAG: autotransporter-associated beta strand repeat-containing protein [bacterium]
MRKITLMFLYAVLLASLPALAGDITWQGTTSSDFTNASNWVGGVAPNEMTDRAVFPSGLTSHQPTLMADRNITGIVFQSTSGGWTIGGAGKTIYWGGARYTPGGAGLIDDSLNATGTDTINANIASEGSGVWNVGAGGLVVNGDIMSDSSGGTFSLNGGTATVARLAGGRGISLGGNGTWIITSASNPNYTNSLTTLSACRIVIGNRYALGYYKDVMFGQSTNTMLAASVDLSGANCITNNIKLTGNTANIIAGVYGTNNIEFGGLLYTGSGSSPYYLNNNIAAGKKLIVNTFNMNDTTSNKVFYLSGSGETLFNGMIFSANISTQYNNTFETVGTGLTTLNASNAFTGPFKIDAGSMVRLANSNALNGGVGATGGQVPIVLSGGVLELGVADFLCSTGAAAGQVTFTGSGGGFSAYGGKRVVNLGGAGALMTWNGPAFIATGAMFIFNTLFADSEIQFQNPINLAGATRTVQVNDNTATNSDFATLSGVVTNGGLVKTGAGKLVLAGSTNFFASGLTVSNGTLAVNGVTTSSVMTVVGGTALINGAYTGPVTVGSGGALGGTGTLAVANLTLQSNAVMSVTILDGLGHSDALTVTGVLSVTNVTLQVINTNLLTIGQTYRVVNGSHASAFSASNVPVNWTIDYANPGFIQLRSGGYSGTMIKIQ